MTSRRSLPRKTEQEEAEAKELRRDRRKAHADHILAPLTGLTNASVSGSHIGKLSNIGVLRLLPPIVVVAAAG